MIKLYLKLQILHWFHFLINNYFSQWYSFQYLHVFLIFSVFKDFIYFTRGLGWDALQGK